jgi:O-antigen ligase
MLPYPSTSYVVSDYSTSVATTNIWSILWAIALAWVWLLPNHHLPWTSFHSEAWAAFVCGVAVLCTIFVSGKPIEWSRISLFGAVLSAVPLAQAAIGIIPFAGQAWLSTSYLLALSLAILCGMRWERVRPGELPTALFLAIGIASILSVGLQLHQWFQLDRLGMLFSIGLNGGRPYANLGQPNQLGTLLLLGLLASAWGFHKNKISPATAILMACFLLLGIALTKSRTAWIGLAIILVFTWAVRNWWYSKRVPQVFTLLCLYFIACNLAITWIDEAVYLGGLEVREVGVKKDDLRLLAWRLFVDAALQQPWLGYGWTPVGHAQLAVALEHPNLGITFQHSHNLFIELMLWCGIPLGLLVSIMILWWFIRKMRAAHTIDDMLLLTFIAIVGNHAMLELPLHYAYFLLPVGLVIGALEGRLSEGSKFYSPRWTLLTMWMIGALLFSLIVRDYLRVEESYFALRFERARIGTLPPAPLSEVTLLTQMREELRLGRYEPVKNVSDVELDWIREATYAKPGISEFYRYAKALALNDKPLEAQQELRKMCKIVPEHACDLVRRVWEQDSRSIPEIAAVKWPV